MLEIQVCSTSRRAIDHLLHEGAVLRMDPFQQQLQIRLHRPVVSKDAISFVRPGDSPRRDVPAETTGATQLLRLRQIGLASAQLLLRSFALGNVRRNAAGKARLPFWIQTEHSALVNPAYGAVRLDDSILNIVIIHLLTRNPA